MAVGKKIGEFSLKMASSTFTPEPGNSMALQVNYEGSVTGEIAGLHRGTMSVVIVPGTKSRTYTYCGMTWPTKGDPVVVNSQGTLENMADHKRRMRGVGHLSDGSIIAVEGEIDITEGRLTGTLYEWS
jgi:hypothetical protein